MARSKQVDKEMRGRGARQRASEVREDRRNGGGHRGIWRRGGKDAGRQMEKGGREGASVRIAKVI